MTIRRTQLLGFNATATNGERIVARPMQSNNGICHAAELVNEDGRESFVRHTVTWIESPECWDTEATS